MAREYFLAYHSYLESMELLSDAEKGRLFTACLIYSKTGEAPQLGGNERFVFPAFRSQIDRDNAEYAKRCATNKRNGELGGNRTVPNGTERGRTGANGTDRPPNAPQGKGEGKGEGEGKEEGEGKGEYTPPLPPSRGGRGHEEDPFSVFAGENKDLLKAFREFEKMRNKIKKPLTNRAKELTISDLKKLSGNPTEWIAILDQSVQRSYQGVFALKTEYQGRQRVPAGSAGTSPLGSMEREALARMLGGQNAEEEIG